MKISRKKNTGEMLIEIVVAIGIIALVLVGISDLMTRSARVVTYQQQNQEAIAIIKKMLADYKVARDSDPQNFYDNAANAIIDPCVADKPYKCLVTMDKGLDSVLITVKAEWTDGGRTYSVSLSESLSREIK